VLGVPFFKGRNFTEEDSRDTVESTAKVDAMVKARRIHPLPGVEFPAIINRTMAKTFWPGQEALGQAFELGGIVQARVIGIVGDVNEWGIREPVIPEAYRPSHDHHAQKRRQSQCSHHPAAQAGARA
jgi:hypothetical protein